MPPSYLAASGVWVGDGLGGPAEGRTAGAGSGSGSTAGSGTFCEGAARGSLFFIYLNQINIT